MGETPSERAARVERLYEKCARRGGGSMTDVEQLRNDVREFAADLALATMRAETAEAAYHRLDSEQAGAGSYAARAEAAEAEVARLRAHLDAIAAAQESGRAARNRLVEISTAHDLAMLNENCELRTRAEHAEAERDQLRARLEALTNGHPRCCTCGKNLGYRNHLGQMFCWPCADGESPAAHAALEQQAAERDDEEGGAS